RTAALIIDPHISLRQVYGKYLDKKHLELKAVVDTHTHADHFSLAAVLKKEFKVPVIMHEKAISEVATQRVKDGDEISIGQEKLKVIYAPGHTDDTINLYAQGMVFTADVLLIGSVGRSDFQNGSPDSMFDTLQKLKALAGNTIVFPGHDYHEKKSSTIAIEKEQNPFLREGSRDNFVADMRSKILQKPFNIDNIIRVNRQGEALSLEMISPKEAAALSKSDPQVKFLDVRSVLEFSQEHIKDSLNLPIDMLAAKVNELSQARQTYIVLCRTGNRSPMAADMLMQSGIHTVKVMDGGLTGWQKEKLPVIKGEGGVSLERQVRIIAGSIVLLGIILSRFIHPGFIGISILVCCGLIYAGFTDNCLMGMLLMRLPYNRKLYKAKMGGGTCSI
ncbi:MAG: rhodanese-like domain-containing protein, partial [Candidatus Omnitrophica bacterium]|nr:rhodanese-like domain-containing protein [Candidatus Omnitrophota bacterium]